MSMANDRTLIQFQREFSNAIRAPGPLVEDARLRIYRSGYRLRIEGALAEDFPLLESILGEKRFVGLVDEFLQATPSTYVSLAELGKSFVPFLKSRADALGLGFLPDLANYEWSKVLCALAPVPAPPAHDPRTLSENDVPLLSPSAIHWKGSYPVHLLENAVTDDGRIPALEARECRLLIWKTDGEVHSREIAAPEATLLRILCEGGSIATLAQAGAERGFDPAAFQDLFSEWTRSGILTGWKTGDSNG